jgi:hypothetical protein
VVEEVAPMSWSASGRAWLARVALVALLWLLGGRAGLLLGAGIVVVELARPLPPRLLLAAALLLLGAVPLVVLVRGLPSRATLGPEIASGSLVPHVMAGTALALLVLGVLRDVREHLPTAPPRELETPDADQHTLASRHTAGELERGEDPASNGQARP